MAAHQHGKEMATVKVGSGEQAQEFVIHKSLVCAASEYFRGALRSYFKESTNNTVTLEQECPLAFAVFYHFLYAGKVSEDTDFYTQSRVPEDVLWLRVLKLADFLLLHPLVVISYERIRQIFPNKTIFPSRAFITELYDDAPQEKIQRYIVAHSAYRILNDTTADWKLWKPVLEVKEAFGTAVAVQIAKTQSTAYLGYKGYPYQDPALYTDDLFPEPKAAMSEDAGFDGGMEEGGKEDSEE
jgi:BTB/POZ domain